MTSESRRKAPLRRHAALAFLLLTTGCALPEDVDSSAATTSGGSAASVASSSSFASQFLTPGATSDASEAQDVSALDLSKLPEDEAQFDSQLAR